jgi:uncharacterized protein with PQ loop repeat
MSDVRKTPEAPASIALIGPRAARVTENVAELIEPHVDRVVMLLGVIYPLAMSPQLYNVWVLNRTAGLSGITSIVGLVVSVIWVIYGLLHRQRPIWVANLVWVCVHATMAAGILR